MAVKWKSRLSAMLVALMMTSVAAACSDNSGSTAPQSEGNTDSAVKTDAPAADAEGPFSLAADNKIVEDELAKVTTPDYFKNTPTYEYLFEINNTPEPNSFGPRYFEKKFNVKLKHVGLNMENRQEQLNLMFATGKVPDLVVVSLAGMQEYSKQGLLAEVSVDLVKKNMPGYSKIIEEYDPNLFNITKVDGKSMGLSRFTTVGGIPRPASIRADWLKNTGVTKVPSTLEELEQAFLKFRTGDPDKNGKKDTYALSNPSDASGVYWFQSIFGAFGTNPFIWVERNGSLQFGLTLPETKEALKLLNKWHQMEIIDPEFITDKGRTGNSEDLSTKFAKGKIGYIDNLGYDDHQWDNDGHLNYRWVANNPEWKKFFEDNKDNPEKAYSTKAFTDFGDTTPQPIYITMPPVQGPNGQKGYYRTGYSDSVLAFGKQLEKEPQKLEKLLKILEYLNQDEETYVKLGWGPAGIQWNEKNGERIFNPEFNKHALFNNSQTKLGLHWGSNPMYFTSPKWIGAVGGPRSKQRFEYTADVVRKFGYYENKLSVVLPSQSKYSELLDTRVKEYVIKAVAGDIDLDKTFDDTVKKWYSDGGAQLTKEANEWYRTMK